MSKILLEAKELYVNYGAIQALAGFSLKLMENEIVSVIGANGAGKSTFMNAIMGMVKISSGEIFLEGYPLSSQNYKIDRKSVV